LYNKDAERVSSPNKDSYSVKRSKKAGTSNMFALYMKFSKAGTR